MTSLFLLFSCHSLSALEVFQQHCGLPVPNGGEHQSTCAGTSWYWNSDRGNKLFTVGMDFLVTGFGNFSSFVSFFFLF